MKKNIGLVIYVIVFILLIGVFTFFSLIYCEGLDSRKKLIEVATEDGIIFLNGEISYEQEQVKLNDLEEQLFQKFLDIDGDNVLLSIDFMKQKNEMLQEEVTELENEVGELALKRDQLSTQYDTLRKQKEEREQEAIELASTYQIENVKVISQFPNYPTGCECVSLYMLLNYYGVSTTVDDIISRLPQGGWLYTKDDVRYGGNPELEFVGSPYDSQSFGVYEGPIISVANSYKGGIINGRGNSLDTVLGIVEQGRPVMVWTTIHLLTPYVIVSWIYEETMEQMNWYAHEHAVLLIGFSENYVILADPYDGTIKKQRRDLFETIYNALGKRNVYY